MEDGSRAHISSVDVVVIAMPVRHHRRGFLPLAPTYPWVACTAGSIAQLQKVSLFQTRRWMELTNVRWRQSFLLRPDNTSDTAIRQ